MEIDSKDNEVVHLLKKLKEANGGYPQEMFALRRQGYLRQVAEIGGGAGLAWGLRNTIKSAKGSAVPPIAGTLLEALLVVAIVAEAGTVAYFYRDKLADLFQSLSKSPRVEEVSNPPVVTSPIPEFELTVSPVVTETETPVGTPSLDLAAQATNQGANQGANQGSGSGQAVSTPTPNPNDNNGNQYGLTPKPIRTKEPGNNNIDDIDTQDNKSKPNNK